MAPVIWTEMEVASAGGGDRAAAGVVVRASDGTPLAVLGRVGPGASRQAAVYRGMLAGLLRARRLGVRAIRVAVDDPEVAAQLAGLAEIPADLIGLYLQARALLNAFRHRDVRLLHGPPTAEAQRAALRALEEGAEASDDAEPLPLWQAVAG